MDLSDLLSVEGIVPSLKVASKKQAIQELSERAAALTGLPEREIFDTLLQRERLGSTGVGHGVAVPHARLDGLTRMRGVFVRLEQPVAFDSVDDQPVDLIFALFAPAEAGTEHLRALARVSRALRQAELREQLRQARTADAVHALLVKDDHAARSTAA